MGDGFAAPERYNGLPAVKIAGQPAPGHSTGEAMKEMEAMFAKLPPGFSYEWSGQSYEERTAGSQEPMLYTLSMIIVFLCTAALYESWTIRWRCCWWCRWACSARCSA